MSTVVVIGSHGQVGKEIIRVQEIFPELNVIGYGKEDLDITNMSSIKKCLIATNPQYVINCSAYTNVGGAETDVYTSNEVNCEGVGYLAEVCKMIDIPLIHFSTDYIFDGKGEEYVEDDEANPLNQYGMSKYNGECEITKIHDKYFIIRTSWVYSHYEGNFIHNILKKMIKDKSVNVVSDQYGSPTSATDLACLALRLCDIGCEKYGTYHFSSDAEINWYTFADMIKRFAVYYIDIDCTVKSITTDKLNTSVKRPYHVILNCDKLKEALGNDIQLDFDWMESLSQSIYLRLSGKTESHYELQHLFRDTDNRESIAKLYRKIDNLEKRLENRD